MVLPVLINISDTFVHECGQTSVQIARSGYPTLKQIFCPQITHCNSYIIVCRSHIATTVPIQPTYCTKTSPKCDTYVIHSHTKWEGQLSLHLQVYTGMYEYHCTRKKNVCTGKHCISTTYKSQYFISLPNIQLKKKKK